MSLTLPQGFNISSQPVCLNPFYEPAAQVNRPSMSYQEERALAEHQETETVKKTMEAYEQSFPNLEQDLEQSSPWNADTTSQKITTLGMLAAVPAWIFGCLSCLAFCSHRNTSPNSEL